MIQYQCILMTCQPLDNNMPVCTGFMPYSEPGV